MRSRSGIESAFIPRSWRSLVQPRMGRQFIAWRRQPQGIPNEPTIILSPRGGGRGNSRQGRRRCRVARADRDSQVSALGVGLRSGAPYAQLKGSWSCMKNGKLLFHHVLQCVSCWKKELPDGDCRQGRRDYTKCPGTRSRGTWAGDRCYPTASKVHRRQLVADARPDSAQKTGCQGHRFPVHRCTVGPRRHFDGRRESLHASTRGVPSCGAGAHRAPGVGRVASNRRPAEQVHERSHRR